MIFSVQKKEWHKGNCLNDSNEVSLENPVTLHFCPSTSQVVEIEEDMSVMRDDVAGVEDDVDLLLDEQVLQDERILTLEQDSDQLEDDVESMNVCFFLYLGQIVVRKMFFVVCFIGYMVLKAM